MKPERRNPITTLSDTAPRSYGNPQGSRALAPPGLSGLHLGRQQLDEYRIEALLGRGGMGIVYRAENTTLKRTVALKVINPALAADASFVRRFHQEARALAQIHHPNIVFIYALRRAGAGLYIAMEHLEGETLAEALEATGPFPWQKALPIMKQVLAGLAYAHDQGIIHRDLKPRNIMLSRQGIAKIMDFGLAHILEDRREATVTLAQVGTLCYMAPEQARGRGSFDPRSDLFSLGMTFFEMLCGRLPFDKEQTQYTILKTLIEDKMPDLRRFNTRVPRRLAKIVMKALAKDPADRYQSARDMLSALEAFEAQETRATIRRAPPARTSKAAPPRPISRYVLTGILLCALSLGGYALRRVPASAPETTSEVQVSSSQVDPGQRLPTMDTAVPIILRPEAVMLPGSSLQLRETLEHETQQAPPRPQAPPQVEPPAPVMAKRPERTTPLPHAQGNTPPSEDPINPLKPETRPVERTAMPYAQRFRRIILPQGRRIMLRLDQGLAALNGVEKGDQVRLRVAEDVIVDGEVLIQKGTPAFGRITRLRRARMVRPGELRFILQTTQAADEQPVPLYSEELGSKRSRGKQAFIKAGTLFEATVARALSVVVE